MRAGVDWVESMSQCPYCGGECDDSALECPVDRTSLDAALLNSAGSESDFRITPAGKISLAAGLIGNGAIVVLFIPFLLLSRGAIIGSSSWAIAGIAIACCTFIAGLPTALVSLRSCSRWVSLLGLLLSVSPWPLSLLLVNLIAAVRGLHFGP
jgi:hypothetical protein